MNIWQEVRKKIKLGIRENFTEIRKLMGYKSEESFSEILGITRQTLAKFREPDEINDNTNNTLLISILALIDQFIYSNRYDFDNIRDYLTKIHTFFFDKVIMDEKLRLQVQSRDPFFFELCFDFEKIEYKYINIWLKTFKYESEETLSVKEELVDYTKLTINKIIDRYHIYITCDFLLHKNSVEFLKQFCDILLKKNRKIRISNFTIDMIQRSRISTEYDIYQNGVKALQLLNELEELKALSMMKSNNKSRDEIELIINEILEKDMNNVIVLSQDDSYKILSSVDNRGDVVTKIITKQYKVLSLNLTDEAIDINKKQGYKVCSLWNYLKNND